MRVRICTVPIKSDDTTVVVVVAAAWLRRSAIAAAVAAIIAAFLVFPQPPRLTQKAPVSSTHVCAYEYTASIYIYI